MKKKSSKSLIEDCKPLSVAGLARERCLEYGARWTWTITYFGKQDQIDVTCVGNDEGRYLRLRYSLQRSDDPPLPMDERIDLAGESSMVGGWRWWLVCPRCQTRRRVLYMPPNASRFACRVCHNLRYKSSLRSRKTRTWRRWVYG